MKHFQEGFILSFSITKSIWWLSLLPFSSAAQPLTCTLLRRYLRGDSFVHLLCVFLLFFFCCSLRFFALFLYFIFSNFSLLYCCWQPSCMAYVVHFYPWFYFKGLMLEHTISERVSEWIASKWAKFKLCDSGYVAQKVLEVYEVRGTSVPIVRRRGPCE